MKTWMCVCVWVTCFVRLSAGTTTLVVTPASLSEWIFLSGDAATLSARDTLALPADAQLARAFPGTLGSLLLTTQAGLGEDPADWPMLEFGEVALVLSRNGNTGSLLLVHGENEPQAVLPSFPLDNSGRTASPLTLQVRQGKGGYEITLAGQRLFIPVAASTREGFELVFSSGLNQPWEIDQLVVSVFTPDPVVPPVRNVSTSTDRPLAPVIPLAPAGPPGAGPVMPAALESVPLAAADAVSEPAINVATRRSTLRLFTPPAFGKSRIESIRATLRRQNSR